MHDGIRTARRARGAVRARALGKNPLGGGGSSLANRLAAGAQPAGEHVHVEWRRPAHQCDSDQPRHRGALCLIGDFDRQGGNVSFPKVPVNDVSGKEFLPKEASAIRVGRERKPLGPPAKPGNCAAYDIFNAILNEQPYPIKALLNFGSNTVMSNADSERGARGHESRSNLASPPICS